MRYYESDPLSVGGSDSVTSSHGVMRKFAALVTAASFLLACSSYTPIPVTQATPGGSIRLTISESASGESFGLLGSQVRAIDGDVRSVDDSVITIAASEVTRTSGDDERVHGEILTIPRRDISSVDRKHLAVVRSLLLTGLIVGGVIWIGLQGHGQVNQIQIKGPSPQQ